MMMQFVLGAVVFAAGLFVGAAVAQTSFNKVLDHTEDTTN